MASFTFPFFVASHLVRRTKASQGNSWIMVNFAIVGIALSIAVMLLTIFIGRGFNQEVKNRLSYITGDIKLFPSQTSMEGGSSFFVYTEAMEQKLLAIPSIASVRKVVELQGIVKTDSSYRGVMALGFDSLSLATLYKELKIEGGVSNRKGGMALLSLPVARQLQLKEGDKIPFFSLTDKLSIRVYTLSGVTDIPEVNGGVLTLPIENLRQQAQISRNEVSYLEIFLKEDIDNLEEEADRLSQYFSHNNTFEGQRLSLNTTRELMPALYDWIDMLDSNSYILLFIMAVVAGFTAITGILVLILSRTRMIGLLRGLGASLSSLRILFLYLGGNITLKGILWGNVIAFSLAGIQYFWHIIPLNPATYYISYVPISFVWHDWIVVNLLAFVLILLMLFLPTRVIARIKPAKTLRFS